MNQFYRELPDLNGRIQRVEVSSPTHYPQKDTAIRLYCGMYKIQWNLQVRGFYRDANFRKGKKWYIANASLNADDLRALRDACNEALADLDA